VAIRATSNDDLHGTPLVDMADEDVLRPVIKAVTTHLILATAVARHMIPRHTGVILAMGGGREAIPGLGGSHIAWSALSGLCRQLAGELGRTASGQPGCSLPARPIRPARPRTTLRRP
jgi:NAD(P)-dependent dehydrogenase (short-subunit alcohol dehydrogenase family)